MEDLKLRLKYVDINIRSRCIEKLYNAVKKKTKGSIINASSVQIPEFGLILEACKDNSVITSNLAVDAVISLVANNCIHTNYAIVKLLGCMKSPSNYYTVIKGICTVLIHEHIQATENHTGSKYSLLVPKHPLICAIEDTDDSLPFALECVTESLSEDYDKTFQVMEPVICYVLCNPLQKQKFSYIRNVFLERLISCQQEVSKPISNVMMYIPLMQIESLDKTAEVSYCLVKLYQIAAQTDSMTENIIESLLLAFFSLAERSLMFGHNPTQVFALLMELCKLLPKINLKSSTPINICFVLVSFMLRATSGHFLSKLIILTLEMLEIGDVSPTVTAILALSVLHLLPELSLTLFNDSLKTCLSKLLEKLETIFWENRNMIEDSKEAFEDSTSVDFYSENKQQEIETFNFMESFTSSVETATSCVRFSKILDESKSSFKLSWLKCIRQYTNSSSKENFEMVYSLVAALFLMSPDNEVFLRSCLETLESILLKSPHLSTRVFSLLLYKLSLVECPKSKLLILNFLPKSAVHKYAVPPVLSVLQMMAHEKELKAQAIYLMLQLWKRQDRCFPHLQSLLTEADKATNFDSGVNEVLIAQAAAILEICSTEPEKHGHHFLNTLSSIFNKCNDEASLSVACLAVDGIIALCKSEIIDIRSTWKALSSRLGRDKRALVSCRMYHLLALIPEMRVKSFDYDKFMGETVANIWKQISTGSTPSVMREAFETLAKFPIDCHVLKQLPAAAKTNLKLPPSLKATPFEMSKLPEDVLSYIPGYCFVDLMMNFDDSIILEGYTSFLHSLVLMEVEELPRSVYSQTRHVSKCKKVSEALGKVPEFLCTQFQARKSPALQKNLAVGVLFCYEPPLEMGKDGLPLKRSIASQSRSYEQVLTVLLNEVNIDASEWHRCILISNAWGAFIERAFFACEEARKAELDLQCSHGHLDLTSDELNFKSKTAWLWVRDRLLGIIKANTKNTFTSHANSIFAVSALVPTLEKFYASLDEASRTLSDETEELLTHRNFTAEYVDTVICAMYPEYHASGKVQSWLLTHLSRPNSSANYLVRGCASASMCHLTSSLISSHVDEIPNIVHIMLENLAHSSPVLSFYSGKGLGLFVKSLCEAGYPDAGESQVNLLLNTVMEAMKMYNDSEGSLTSCLIALTLSIASMSQTTNERIKDWVSTTSKIFYEKLMDEEKSSMQFEMLCICVTAMIISAAEGSCLPVQNVEDLSSWIEMNRLELPQCSGISMSLGMLIEAFERFGHSEGAEIKQKVLKGWFNTFTSEKRPTLQRIASLNGLCSLFSCGRGLMQVKVQSTAESLSTLNDLIPVMFQILSATRDTGLQNICSWEVGKLFSVHANNQQVDSSVASSYSYLGEKSVLKPMMNMVISYHKKAETTSKYCHIIACLKSLAEPFPRPLPPINWTTVLTPFLQQSKDTEAVEASLKIAVHQSNGSAYAANLVSSYCIPPLIHSLPESCLKILLDNIPNLLIVLPPPKLQMFLQTIILQTVKRDDALETLGKITMQGILSSLKLTGYKEQSKKVLHDSFIVIFRHLKTSEYMKKFLPWMSEAFLLLPTEILDSIMLVSQNVDDVSQLTMLWCYLVKNGRKPLQSLKPCIEEGKCSSLEQKEKICFYIYDCFLNGTQNSESEANQTDKCISWLLEIIGWINVLEDSKSKYQLLTTGEVYTFLTDVCLATIIGCSGLENSYHLILHKNLNHYFLLESFPQAVNKLSQINEWNGVINKVIDWLVMMLKSQYLKENEKYYIKLSLCSLRSTSQFQKKEVWTEVVCNVIKNE